MPYGLLNMVQITSFLTFKNLLPALCMLSAHKGLGSFPIGQQKARTTLYMWSFRPRLTIC